MPRSIRIPACTSLLFLMAAISTTVNAFVLPASHVLIWKKGQCCHRTLSFVVGRQKPTRRRHPWGRRSFTTVTRLSSSPSDDDNNNKDGYDESSSTSPIEKELERLQEQLALIEALEARNEAQIHSFIDEQDQWDSMEQDERDLLESKPDIVQKMEVLAEQLVVLWMGQKSQDG